MTKMALIVGANGGVGSEVSIALRRHGWRIRALVRRMPTEVHPADSQDSEYVIGDAMRRDDVIRAARGAALLVHAVNPPGYQRWAQLVVPMIDNSIAAARASGARIVLPGTVYNYGPDAFPVLSETSPQRPLTRKGAIRVSLERRLEEAGRDGVRSLIVRAGDFFGPQPGNNWFSQCLVKPGVVVKSILYPGVVGVGHAWAYLPDLAETIARLADREQALESFERFHFGGHWDFDGTQMIEAIRHVVGKPTLPVRCFPWSLLHLAAPFWTLAREMREMRYLWEQPLRLENAKLVAQLGVEPHTPWREAVRETIQGSEEPHIAHPSAK